MRSFVAIPLSQPIRAALVDAASIIRENDPAWRDAKWVPPENLHITLMFLGEIAEDAAPCLADHLAHELAQATPTPVILSGLRGLPGPERARMLWAHFAQQGADLATIARTIEVVASTFGIKTDRRPFNAHATLVRARKPGPIAPGALSAAEERLWSVLGQEPVMSVGEARLYKSTLTSTGAIYEEMAVLPFSSSR